MNTDSNIGFDLTQPAPEAPPQPRWWIVLWGLLFLLGGRGLMYYFQHDSVDRSGTSAKYAIYEQTLLQEVELRPVGKLFQGMGTTKVANDALADTISDLAQKRAKDKEAQRWYALSRTELGDAVEPSDVALLAASKSDADVAFAQIYSAKKIEPAQAKALAARLKGDEFWKKLARVQVLEKSGDDKARDVAFPVSNALRLGLLGSIVLGGGFLGVILLIIVLSKVVGGQLRPLGPPLRATKSVGDRLAGKAAQALLAFVLVPAVFLELPMKRLSQAGQIMVVELTVAAAALILCWFPIDSMSFSPKTLGLTFRRFGSHFLWGIGGAVAVVPIVLVLAIAGMSAFRGLPTPQNPIEPLISHSGGIPDAICLIITAAIGAPIIEELVFRGLLLPALASRMKPSRAIIIQGLLFGMIHPTGIPAWAALASVGIMSGLLTYQTKSLVPSVVMHAFYNAVLVTISLTLLHGF